MNFFNLQLDIWIKLLLFFFTVFKQFRVSFPLKCMLYSSYIGCWNSRCRKRHSRAKIKWITNVFSYAEAKWTLWSIFSVYISRESTVGFSLFVYIKCWALGKKVEKFSKKRRMRERKRKINQISFVSEVLWSSVPPAKNRKKSSSCSYISNVLNTTTTTKTIQ